MVYNRIIERNIDGEMVNEFSSMREAGIYHKISPSTIAYSVAHPGHVIKHTSTAFYAEAIVDHCGECRYGAVYDTLGGKVHGCGYCIEVGTCRGGKWSECEKWKE